MQTILLLNNEEDWAQTVPSFTARQAFGYNTWGEICRRRGVELTRACFTWFSAGRFEKAWRYTGSQRWEKVDQSIYPTVVYDRCANYRKDTGDLLYPVQVKKAEIDWTVNIVNSPWFDGLLDNKFHQSVLFSQYMPASRLVKAGTILDNRPRRKLVVKNLRGSGGYQVVITDAPVVKISHGALVQTFIDGRDKEGVLRDTRLVFIDDAPAYALARVAQPGSYHTNLHQGARIEFLNLADQQPLLQLAQRIIKPLAVFPQKVFTLDFLTEAQTGRHYLMELNTKPGLDVFDETSQPILQNYLEKLTDYLLASPGEAR